MMLVKKWIKDFFSEPDGETICPLRVLGICGFTWALCMSGWSVLVMKAAFDIVAFGTAYAAMLAALGVGLGLKTDNTKATQ